MNRFFRYIFFLCLLCGIQTFAYGQGKHSVTRGQLLYSTHCIACHTSQIHWREKKLVTDWGGLVMQVRHWQAISGLNWTEDEIADVAHYLNSAYYRYKNTAQSRNPDQGLYKD